MRPLSCGRPCWRESGEPACWRESGESAVDECDGCWRKSGARFSMPATAIPGVDKAHLPQVITVGMRTVDFWASKIAILRLYRAPPKLNEAFPYASTSGR